MQMKANTQLQSHDLSRNLSQEQQLHPSGYNTKCADTGTFERDIYSKILQGKSLRTIFPESPAKLYCCCGVIMVLTVAVVALSVALSATKTEQILVNKTYAACPQNWIGSGNKCFYFSEYTSNWTFAQNFCMAQEAQLARFDNQDELNFLMRYKGTFDFWIGLHRESSERAWKWTDNTEYNNTDVFTISSRNYTERKWICSKSSNYTLLC
uniref:C-type lectin domain family member J n=2 Tax=Mus musculus TaxID=10090 RepID=I1W6W0_MOUSE|nr:ClrH [Mus musculus]AFK08665.1 C-type lectin domain family member J [Mus musculus]